MRKKDLRVIKTEYLIKSAFIDLVEEKGYRKVSVDDIATKAYISRNTFYLHYESKESLVESIINETIKRIEATLNDSFKDIIELDKLSIVHVRWWFRYFLRQMKDETEIYRVILLDDSLKGYFENFKRRVSNHISKILNVKSPRSSLVFEYTVSGMFGVFEQYVTYPLIDENENTRILADLAYNSLMMFRGFNYEK